MFLQERRRNEEILTVCAPGQHRYSTVHQRHNQPIGEGSPPVHVVDCLHHPAFALWSLHVDEGETF
jgi:hypothetical protein